MVDSPAPGPARPADRTSEGGDPQLEASFARRLLADEIDAGMPQLLELLVARVADLPEYASQSLDQASADYRGSVLRHLEVVRDLGRDEISVEDARAYAFAAAKRRALGGIPLDAVLRSYQFTSREFWQWLVDTTLYRSWGREALRHSWDLWLDYVNLAIGAAADAYTEAARDRSEAGQAARRTFVGLLLGGRIGEEEIRRWLTTFGHSEAQEFLLVVLGLGPDGNGSADVLTAAGAAVARDLRRQLGVEAVDYVGPTDVVVFVVGRELDVGRIERVVGATLAESKATAVITGVAQRPGVLADVHAHALKVAATGRAGAVTNFRGMGLLEHSIAALRGSGQHLLPADLRMFVARARAGEASLWEQTLVAWLDCDLNVRETAIRLHVHPNSVYYRLRRIQELSGRDPGRVRDLLDLLVAFRLAPATDDAGRTV